MGSRLWTLPEGEVSMEAWLWSSRAAIGQAVTQLQLGQLLWKAGASQAGFQAGFQGREDLAGGGARPPTMEKKSLVRVWRRGDFIKEIKHHLIVLDTFYLYN